MLAVLAAVVFLVGLIVRLVTADFDFSDVWIWLLLGLTFLAAHHAWPEVDRRRRVT